MKALYAARMSRFDLLRATCSLATRVTKWTRWCDKALHRLICYIDSSLVLRMFGTIAVTSGGGKPPTEVSAPTGLELHLFCDADLAGCPETAKSTSGVYLALVGPGGTHFPLAGISKKQTSTSHSTAEAEMVALDLAVRTEGIPALSIWDVLLQRKTQLRLMEDNQATIRILETGKCPTLRHVSRTQHVCVRWLHERVTEDPQIHIQYCDTNVQAADIFTKQLSNAEKWTVALRLLSMHDWSLGGRQWETTDHGVVKNKSSSGSSSSKKGAKLSGSPAACATCRFPGAAMAAPPPRPPGRDPSQFPRPPVPPTPAALAIPKQAALAVPKQPRFEHTDVRLRGAEVAGTS